MSLRSHHGFHRKRGAVQLTLKEPERAILGDLLTQLIDMVAPDPSSIPADPLAAMVGIAAEATTPEDPALARLLPDAYADPELAGEFRRFTEGDLRSTKVANARMARDCLDRPGTIQLTAEEANAWLTALNDLRLVLGTRLEVSEDGPPDPSELTQAGAAMYTIYDWLTYMQDRLVGALSRR